MLALPFEVVLPDDADARAPRAQLRIDNTSLEVIVALRGLVDPLGVTLQILRASAPDVIEREWTGLDGRPRPRRRLHLGDARRRRHGCRGVPFETFDGRFAGLWP